MAAEEPDASTLRQRKQEGSGTAPDDKTDFTTLVVVEFSSKVPSETVEWLQRKMSASRGDGGAELLVRQARDDNKQICTLHLGGTTRRLLLGAELMEMKKPHKDGSLHEISLEHLSLFRDSDDPDTLLTMAEKQRVILHELESIRALEADQNIPGLNKAKLYTGEAIVPKCIHEALITQVFPLHDREELKVLAKEWYQTAFTRQPIVKIQRYFGDTLAMYFSFLGFYTMALVPPAVIGLVSKFFVTESADIDLILFFSIFNLVWVTLFLEAWKRHSATLAYQWGTIKSEPFEEARAAYYGKLGRNKVTDRLEPKYPKWKRVLKFYGVSLPVVLLCLFGAFQVMLYYFYWEGLALQYDRENKTWWSGYLTFVPSIVYAVVIIILNALYRMLAKALNNWENHRLESAYEKHFVTKLVLFDFVNCFLSLFYIAFYQRDMKMLRMSLGTLLIVQQVVQQCQETLIPYLIYKYRKGTIRKRHKTERDGATEADKSRQAEDEQAEIEATKDLYMTQAFWESGMVSKGEGTLDDYLELFLQFGYVFLFSAVYPTAAFWALLNNVAEIRSDAFKMCRVFQRPFSRPTSGIGAWQIAFEVMSVMAVMTNCALIAISPHAKVWFPEHGEVDILMWFILAEHVILLLKMMLSFAIPDEPEWVQCALERNEYQAKRAWRKQRYDEAQKMLKLTQSLRKQQENEQ